MVTQGLNLNDVSFAFFFLLHVCLFGWLVMLRSTRNLADSTLRPSGGMVPLEGSLTPYFPAFVSPTPGNPVISNLSFVSAPFVSPTPGYPAIFKPSFVSPTPGNPAISNS